MKRILLPTDFSPAAENAIQYALNLFESEICEYVLMHSFGIPSIGAQTRDWQVYQGIVEEAEKKLKQLEANIQPLIHRDRQHLRSLILADLPSNAIKHLVEAEHIDWVILGTSGQDLALTFSNVVTTLIQANRCNTLIIPVHSEHTPFANIVLATNYVLPHLLDTLEPVREFVLQNHARLTLLTVSSDKKLPGKLEAQDLIQHYFDGLTKQIAIEQDSNILSGIINFIDTHQPDILFTIAHQPSFWSTLSTPGLIQKLANRPLVPLAVLVDRKDTTSRPVQQLATDLSL
ncbi:universal stress protein [Spirosoma litoris]